eukprot:765289-Hanusia_phi.AAC.3
MGSMKEYCLRILRDEQVVIPPSLTIEELLHFSRIPTALQPTQTPSLRPQPLIASHMPLYTHGSVRGLPIRHIRARTSKVGVDEADVLERSSTHDSTVHVPRAAEVLNEVQDLPADLRQRISVALDRIFAPEVVALGQQVRHVLEQSLQHAKGSPHLLRRHRDVKRHGGAGVQRAKPGGLPCPGVPAVAAAAGDRSVHEEVVVPVGAFLEAFMADS